MSGQRRVKGEQKRRFLTSKVKRLFKVDIRCTFQNQMGMPERTLNEVFFMGIVDLSGAA